MISAVLKGLTAVLTKILVSVASEKVIEWLFFYVAEQIVKTTKTPHDDEFYAQIKAAYEGKKEESKESK